MSVELYILTQKYGLDYDLAHYIIDKVWNDLEKPNIRDCENVSKLSNNSIEMVDLVPGNIVKSQTID